MAESNSTKPTSSSSSSDEIDLGQLFQSIRNGFNGLFRRFLRFFLYLKKNFVILAALVFIGFAIGFALKYVISAEQKTEVIVKTNFGSANYLYGVVDEIEANLKAKDTLFFKDLDIVISELKNLKIDIDEIKITEDELDEEVTLDYLTVLQDFKEDNFVLDAIRREIERKSNRQHRITFFYKNALAGRSASIKLMQYIENNTYFSEVKEVNNQNSRAKIEKNEELVAQIDELVRVYVDEMSKPNSAQATVTLDGDNGLNIGNLLDLKNELISDSQQKRLDMVAQDEVIQIINYGQNQTVKTPVYAQSVTVVPMIFLCLFFLYSFIAYLNRKSSEIENEQ